MRGRALWLPAAIAVVFLVMPMHGALATSTGGCPSSTSEKWVLATVAGLGISEDQASGIPSLDGNGDGNTCIRKLGTAVGPVCDTSSPIVFRDNTVAGTGGTPLDCGLG
jgi:hypothetical protein